jgi:hypothetical protein
MGYKLLGFVVWRGARLYLRRRMPGAPRKAAIAGLAGLAALGAVAVVRQQGSSEP